MSIQQQTLPSDYGIAAWAVHKYQFPLEGRFSFNKCLQKYFTPIVEYKTLKCWKVSIYKHTDWKIVKYCQILFTSHWIPIMFAIQSSSPNPQKHTPSRGKEASILPFSTTKRSIASSNRTKLEIYFKKTFQVSKSFSNKRRRTYYAMNWPPLKQKSNCFVSSYLTLHFVCPSSCFWTRSVNTNSLTLFNVCAASRCYPFLQ